MHTYLKASAFFLFFYWGMFPAFGQDPQNLSDMGIYSGAEYEIGGIRITGANNLDPQVIGLITGLNVGDRITLPGEQTTQALKALWRQRLFDDISILVTEKKGDVVFLEIRLSELPKLSKYGIRGLKKGERDNLREALSLERGAVVTQNLINITKLKTREFFKKDGYFNAEVVISKKPDTTENNALILELDVDKGEKVKVKDINFIGNEKVEAKTLRKAMKEVSRKRIWNIFKSAKFVRSEYRADLKAIVGAYNKRGFRDATIIKDTVRQVSPDRVVLDITVNEGRKYYFGDVTWLGNSKYTNEVLSSILKINRGDIYDAAYLQERLFMDPQGGDVSSLYLNNGYLFFNVNPVEVSIVGDTINLEMRVSEGRQATINKVTVVGNDRTNDHVIYRELRTRPGELFRRSDIQRSLRELQQLGFFDPTKLDVVPIPNAQNGTVDIEYKVAEQSTSQLQLQGGWGAGRIVGTLGLNFNNFSARNIFKKGSWRPLPSGDGQSISLRAQSNGSFFQSYSMSFTEPWLGGKKPNSLTVSLFHNIQNFSAARTSTENQQRLNITGVTVGLGQRLRWPDDYFTLQNAIEFQRYFLNNFDLGGIRFTEGNLYNINYRIALGRNSVDFPIYPRQGSKFSISYETTFPYSLVNYKDYSELGPQERYEFLEYYKFKTDAAWYTEIFPKTVIKAAGEFGFLGDYSEEVGIPPFERFFVGGDGLQNFVLDGREIIGLRGYPNNQVAPVNAAPGEGGSIYNKLTMEMRYLITENPSAQIFVLGFAEAGNNYLGFENYEPFELKRSAGFGVRIFMPMFGLLGVDVAYGFDNLPGLTPSGWNTHFTIGQQF